MGPSTIWNTRMWTFLFLYILAINFFEAAQEGNSTQMLYAKLIIDKSAIENITRLLKPFVRNTDLYVKSPVMTTECRNVSDKKECHCKPGYRWNDALCQSNPACCGDTNCTLEKSADVMCVLNTTVTITGSLILQGATYTGCLTDSNLAVCRDLLTKLKAEYSTLEGFDSLNIIRFRLGSIITDFKMIIASTIDPQALINISVAMSQSLSASLSMETSGVVNLTMPNMPVLYGAADQTITCRASQNLETDPKWSITNINGKYDITTGTVSTFTILSSTESTVRLKEVTELWRGQYLCVYQQNKVCPSGNCSINILHKGSAQLDVALRPSIEVYTQPSFPHCKSNSDVLQVTATCVINNSSEPYNVAWEGDSLTDKSETMSGNQLVYTTKKIISCDPNNKNGNATVCIFMNRLGQKTNSSVPFNIIYAGENFCPADGDWEDTKADFTAVLKCQNSAGQRRRACNSMGQWGAEVSECVNSDLYNVLQNAIISDTGLGSLDKNAANIFSSLQNATQKSQTINTFANVNASVIILSTMSGKLSSINNAATTNDILGSSSNLLEQSLESSWTQDPKSNKTLAENYLNSVEKLIHLSNTSNNTIKKNVQVQTCSNETCTNKVFNATVTVTGSGNGIIKTAGFQNLQNYLPSNTNTSDPNSIVVSTTAQNNTGNLQIKITFELLRPRPRDVELVCVSWDFNKSQWIQDGCTWAGASNPEVCICNHLTSFAILMSRFPIEIPYMTEITYTGLSVSVVSLVISLLIELIVWSSVVKTNTLYLRHTAHVNISLCLLVADSCFLASSDPDSISEIWCRIAALLKHFCYLAMFFWMLSLSTTLLHQAVFLFHKVSKKNYLRFSMILGYVCPFLIVFITFLTNNGGAEGAYFDQKTCWLIYTGTLKGTIYTFILPVGIIVFINLFSMVVVIMKLLDHKSSEKTHDKEIRAAKTVLRSVILLTPIFGLPWIFGFATFSLDLTSGAVTLAVNYAFVLLNAFQGLFILLTTCLGDKMTREALLNSFRKKAPATISESSTKFETTKKS